MAENTLLKDGIGTTAIRRIADALGRLMTNFPRDEFEREAAEAIGQLELKARVSRLIDVMAGYLPGDFGETAEILGRVPDVWDPGDPEDKLRGLAAWPIIDYVGVHGLGHPAAALSTLGRLTPMFSAEFAIRPFIVSHYDLTYARLRDWTRHPDDRVRRLVSEGTRPRLPWGQRLTRFIDDPQPVIELLERLRNDESELVRRSVANNLNDISKDHPDLAIAVCRRWQLSATDEVEWIIRHATRTLVKQGHPDVFGLLGFTESPRVAVLDLQCSSEHLRIGSELHFSLSLQSDSDRPQRLVIDYAVYHVRRNDRITRKVFKLRTIDIAPGDTVQIKKKHSFKPITTRRYYPGMHSIEILVNGVGHQRTDFELTV